MFHIKSIKVYKKYKSIFNKYKKNVTFYLKEENCPSNNLED